MNIEKTVTLEQLQNQWENSKLNSFANATQSQIEAEFGKEDDYTEFSDDYLLAKMKSTKTNKIAAE